MATDTQSIREEHSDSGNDQWVTLPKPRNQLPDEFVVSMESKEQKQTEDLAGMQVRHHGLQILLPRSLDKYQTKFRAERNEITKTIKDLSIIQHQAELEEKADNEQQLRKELLTRNMVMLIRDRRLPRG